MIEKRKSRELGLDAVVYERILKQAIARDKLNPHPSNGVLHDSTTSRAKAFRTELHVEKLWNRSRLIKAMSPQINAAAKLNVTVHSIVGGVSAGWQAEASDFYIGLPF